MNLIVFMLVCYGISNIIRFGSIFEWLRSGSSAFGTGGYSLHKLLHCMMCLPTWIGFAVSSLLIGFGLGALSPAMGMGVEVPLLAIFFDGVLASGTTFLIYTLQEYFEGNTPE